MSTEVKHSGTWRTLTGVEVKHSGSWRTIKTIEVKHGGTWREVYSSGPTVSPRADGDYNYRYGLTCWQGCYFYSNGNEYELTSSGSVTNTTTWLDSGTGSDVWVEFVRTGGSKSKWVSHNNSQRYQLSSNQNFYYTVPAIGVNIQSLDGYFRMWDAASGGNNIWTGSTVGWDAEAEGGGGCPLCCFTPDTPVMLASGLYVPIKDINEGDKIAVLNLETNELDSEEVTDVIVIENVPLFEVEFDDGRKLELTPDHPVHARDKGPAAIVKYENYKDLPNIEELQVGDYVANDRDGWSRVTRIKFLRKEPYVITLNNQLFFANGTLVY